jgi:hypothetical protein
VESGDWLRDRIKEKPDLTLRALQAELAARGARVSIWAIWKFCVSEGLSFKKSLLPAEQDRSHIARKRERWKQLQTKLDHAPGVHRRDLDQDQHGSLARPGAARSAAHAKSPARSLEDHDVHRCTAMRSPRRSMRWTSL